MAYLPNSIAWLFYCLIDGELPGVHNMHRVEEHNRIGLFAKRQPRGAVNDPANDREAHCGRYTWLYRVNSLQAQNTS